MARIAKRAGTAHGTVYAYFADKDDLLLALYQEFSADFRTTFAAMPPVNYACFRERSMGRRPPTDASRTPGKFVTFRAARIGMFDLS